MSIRTYIKNIIDRDVDMDPEQLVFLLPTWTSQNNHGSFPDLNGLSDEDRKVAYDHYRTEVYAIYNMLHYYSNTTIDLATPFNELFDRFLMDTNRTTIYTSFDEYVRVSDRGVVYYIPFTILIKNLMKNNNPYTNEPFSSPVYDNLISKYRIELKLAEENKH